MNGETTLKELTNFLARHIGFWPFIGSLFLTCLSLLLMFTFPDYIPIPWPESSTIKQIITGVLVLSFWLLTVGGILFVIKRVIRRLRAMMFFRVTRMTIQSLPDDEKQVLVLFVLRYYAPQTLPNDSLTTQALIHKALIEPSTSISYNIDFAGSISPYNISDIAKSVLEKHPELINNSELPLEN